VVATAASDADRADEIEGEEATAADYKGREGYAAKFLGDRFEIPLPSVVRDAEDVLKYANDGKADTVLRYEHYSVVMSKSRRMCFFSAANIDGGQSRKGARVAWKWDPRIPRTQQIMNECYGAPPKFSRGHMTRREDPGWGDPKTAKRGNEDSMHVTNTTPQMQAFNAPIWLALEDYALQHAREDEMKISVFTGPYFATNDPVMYGIKIPRAFWKVIAFIHDDTGELCATGYQMTQQQSLPDEEFVFGTFTSPQLHVATQVPIASIETLSGLSFGDLASVDPLADGDEAVGTGPLQTSSRSGSCAELPQRMGTGVDCARRRSDNPDTRRHAAMKSVRRLRPASTLALQVTGDIHSARHRDRIVHLNESKEEPCITNFRNARYWARGNDSETMSQRRSPQRPSCSARFPLRLGPRCPAVLVSSACRCRIRRSRWPNRMQREPSCRATRERRSTCAASQRPSSRVRSRTSAWRSGFQPTEAGTASISKSATADSPGRSRRATLRMRSRAAMQRPALTTARRALRRGRRHSSGTRTCFSIMDIARSRPPPTIRKQSSLP
jgi:DNA/RNA endonuclease G (NUC1)